MAEQGALLRSEPDRDRAFQDVQTIQHVLAHSRHDSERYWYFFALWGALSIAFFFISGALFAAGATTRTIYEAYWTYAIGVTALSFYLGIRALRVAKIRTFAESGVAATWFAQWISVNLMMAAAQFLGAMDYTLKLAAFTWLLAGMAFFVTGALWQWRFFYISAAICWLGAIAMMASQSGSALWIDFWMMIGAWLLPAYLMRRRWLMRQADEGND